MSLDFTSGYPKGIKNRADIEAVYRECIKKKVTWEELLGYHLDRGKDVMY